MKKLAVLFSLSSILLLSACSKEQRAVNQLDGEWKVTKVETTVLGFTQTEDYDENLSFTFNKCKVSDGYCDGSVNDNGETSNFTYIVENDGEKVLINYGIGEDQEVELEKIDRKTRKMTFNTLDFISQTINLGAEFIPEEEEESYEQDTNEFENDMSGFENLFDIQIGFILEKQ